MDPLTIGFEDAFYEANADLAPDSSAAARLAAALRAVVDASPHRARPVTISTRGEGTIEIRRGAECYVLARGRHGWRTRESRDPSRSGPLAAALTSWLTTAASGT